MKNYNKMINEGERIELVEYNMDKNGWFHEITVPGIRYNGKEYKITTNRFGKTVLKKN